MGRAVVVVRYGPEKSLFEETWKRPGIGKLAVAQAPSSAAPAAAADRPIAVTPDNFVRAETDLYVGAIATKRNGFGKFEHNREALPIDRQTVIRTNRDTLYSGAVFDLDAGLSR